MTDSILRSYQIYTHTSMVPFPAPVPEQLLLDTYTGGVVGFSLRKLRAAYAGSAVRIRRSSDNAEADIGFSGNDFDAAAAATHIGGGSGFITTWYDQSVNAFDATQTTAANQPLYIASGISSKPCMSFDGSNDVLSTASVNFGVSTSVTCFGVLNQTGSDAQNTWFAYGSGPDFSCFATYDNVIYWDFFDNAGGRINVGQPSGWDDNPHIIQVSREAGGSQDITVDGTSLVSGARTGTISPTAQVLAIGIGLGITFTGSMSELIIFKPDLGSSGRSGANTAINSYYGIF